MDVIRPRVSRCGSPNPTWSSLYSEGQGGFGYPGLSLDSFRSLLHPSPILMGTLHWSPDGSRSKRGVPRYSMYLLLKVNITEVFRWSPSSRVSKIRSPLEVCIKEMPVIDHFNSPHSLLSSSPYLPLFRCTHSWSYLSSLVFGWTCVKSTFESFKYKRLVYFFICSNVYRRLVVFDIFD